MNGKRGGGANHVPQFGILEATCPNSLLLPPSCPPLFLLYFTFFVLRENDHNLEEAQLPPFQGSYVTNNLIYSLHMYYIGLN